MHGEATLIKCLHSSSWPRGQGHPHCGFCAYQVWAGRWCTFAALWRGVRCGGWWRRRGVRWSVSCTTLWMAPSFSPTPGEESFIPVAMVVKRTLTTDSVHSYQLLWHWPILKCYGQFEVTLLNGKLYFPVLSVSQLSVCPFALLVFCSCCCKALGAPVRWDTLKVLFKYNYFLFMVPSLGLFLLFLYIFVFSVCMSVCL